MFDRCLFFNVNALTRLVNKKWIEAFKPFDLSPAHGYMLRVVLSKPGITPKDLAIELHLEKSTITRFIDTLEKKGLVIRKSAINFDKRGQSIHPTKKAKDIHASLENLGDSLYQTMISTIGEEQLTMLVDEIQNAAKKLR